MLNSSAKHIYEIMSRRKVFSVIEVRDEFINLVKNGSEIIEIITKDVSDFASSLFQLGYILEL
jgi:hypothetical protein